MQVKRPFRLLSLALVIAVLAALLPGASAARAGHRRPRPALHGPRNRRLCGRAADSLLTISDITLRFEAADTFEAAGRVRRVLSRLVDERPARLPAVRWRCATSE